MSTFNTNVSTYGPELRGFNITRIESQKDGRLGIACWQVNQLEALIDAGLCVARLNFLHVDHAGHQACLDRLREVAKNKMKQIVVKEDKISTHICVFFRGYFKIQLALGMDEPHLKAKESSPYRKRSIRELLCDKKSKDTSSK